MKSLMLMATLILSMVSVQAENRVAEVHNLTLEDAIKSSPLSIRYDLNRCVKNWRLYSEQRAKFNELVALASTVDSPMLVLEIGNSGYGQHEYIVLNGDTMQSSFSKSHITSGRKLLKLYRSLRMNRSGDFIEPGSPSTDDGNCYFLAIKKDGTVRNVAVYGNPTNTKIGSIITLMLSSVR